MQMSLHHFAISVGDLGRSVSFYAALFDMVEDTRVTSDDGLKTIVHMRRDDWYIEIFCHQNALPLPVHCGNLDLDLQTVGVKHGGIATVDIEAAHRHAKTIAGAGAVSAIREARFYKFFFVHDPDGAVIEFVQRK